VRLKRMRLPEMSPGYGLATEAPKREKAPADPWPQPWALVAHRLGRIQNSPGPWVTSLGRGAFVPPAGRRRGEAGEPKGPDRWSPTSAVVPKRASRLRPARATGRNERLRGSTGKRCGSRPHDRRFRKVGGAHRHRSTRAFNLPCSRFGGRARVTPLWGGF
jgi:hypothetical protein